MCLGTGSTVPSEMTGTHSKMPTSNTPVLHLVTVLWGSEYADLFCRITLRSLMAPGNIPALIDKIKLNYFVYTTNEDAQRIQQDPTWHRLQALATVHFKTLPPSDQTEKFALVSEMHLLASNEAARDGAYISYLVPDCVYSDGSIGGLWAYIKDGDVQAVMTLGMRTKRESTLRTLETNYGDEPHTLQISPRDCVALALDNLHEVERAMFWGENEHTTHLSHTYFYLNERSLLAYCWHLHPILVKPKRSDLVSRVGTIDGGRYLDAVIDSWDQVVVIRDSDQFFSLEVSADLHTVGKHLAGPVSVRELAKWARYRGHGIYREFFQTPIWVHAESPEAGDVQLRDRTKYLITKTVVEPVLYLSRFSYLFARKAQVVKWLRAHKSLALHQRLLKVRVGTRRYAKRVALMIFSKLFRHSPLARKLAMKLGSFALAHQTKDMDDASHLLERQTSLVVDLIRNCTLSEATPLIHRLSGNPNADLPKISQELFTVAMARLNSGNLIESCEYFDLSIKTYRTPDNKFYFELVTSLIALKKEAEDRAAAYISQQGEGERFVFSAVVWGSDYIDNFMQYTVRTMLAPGNLPSLNEKNKYFSIVTTPAGAERIRQSTVYSHLELHITVEFFIFPETLTKPFNSSRPTTDFYRLYGALDHTSIHFARALKAHIFFIVVDGLLSNNSISSLRKYLDSGYDICANASIVSDREFLLPEMSKRYEDKDVIDISARELANIGFTHRHHYISQRLVVAENKDFDKYPRELYFPTQDGLIVHALYQHPLVISARAICEDIDFDYYVVDANLMGKILDAPEKFPRLKVITDSDDVYVANYAPAGRKFESTGRALHINDFVAVHHYSLPVHHYIWNHRQLIRCDTMLRTHLEPQKTAETFLLALKKELRKIGKL
jgi:hypothetical protein